MYSDCFNAVISIYNAVAVHVLAVIDILLFCLATGVSSDAVVTNGIAT